MEAANSVLTIEGRVEIRKGGKVLIVAGIAAGLAVVSAGLVGLVGTERREWEEERGLEVSKGTTKACEEKGKAGLGRTLRKKDVEETDVTGEFVDVYAGMNVSTVEGWQAKDGGIGRDGVTVEPGSSPTLGTTIGGRF